ncbi:LCP family protein [Glycomyces sp. L485]|uniref:LCP family protein n=1 Tax=Glycomyces sp. L485 TaxID=2909235 RepID=UPI001F4B6469|nr:LCP family protein [Glycomyces sp. L485]MCH7229464.1 LCP family protein [Glycomyces sp. L485]
MTYSGSNYRGAASVPPEGGGARVAASAADGPTRRGLIGSAVGLVASLAAAGGGAAVWTTANSANSDLNRAFDLEGIPEEDRPEKINGAMNVLILGSDAREEGDDARSDTSIVMHVNEGGTEAYGISVPRDLYVYIPPNSQADYSDTNAKFNAAYAWGGATLTVQTIEELTEARIDHVVEIDFPGLVEVVDALGGVEMDIEPADAPNYYDESGVTSIHPPRRFFPAGKNLLDGEEALDYVRQRYQYASGDFARMRHQQELIKAIMDAAVTAEVLTSQSKLSSFIESVSDAVKVDTQFNVVSTGIEFMHLRSDDIVFMTTPNLGTGTEGGESVVVYDEETASGLWAALREDAVGEWIEANPEAAGQSEDA